MYATREVMIMAGEMASTREPPSLTLSSHITLLCETHTQFSIEIRLPEKPSLTEDICPLGDQKKRLLKGPEVCGKYSIVSNKHVGVEEDLETSVLTGHRTQACWKPIMSKRIGV